MWYKLDVKPLSVNQQYSHIQKKRYKKYGNKLIVEIYSVRVKSKKYNDFKAKFQKLIKQVPVVIVRPDDELHLHLEFGFSSTLSDTTNAIKSAEDLIAEHFGYDDKQNVRTTQEKFKVPKGKEYVAFKLEKIKTKNRKPHV